MRKLLLFFTLCLISIAVTATEINWSSDGYQVTGGNQDPNIQTLTLNKAGALAALAEANGSNFQYIGTNAGRTTLKITGPMNSTDLEVLNRWGVFTSVDLSEATFDFDDLTALNMSGVKYLRLPNGMTSEDDVKNMESLHSGSINPNLKVVGSFDGSNATLPELALYSFAENEVSNFSNQLMNVADLAMVARLAGTYGDKDLMNNGPVFGWTPPCIWDFTGATFTSCTVNAGIEVEYYAYDDPFRDGPTSKLGEGYQTNAFWYFNNYAMQVADIKLPTNITVLPSRSLSFLGHQNIEKDRHKAAYKAYYGLSDEQMTANTLGTSCAIIPDLIIPDNYVKIDCECGKNSHIKHLVVGSGIKIVEAAAFAYCIDLEDLDFGAGLSNCYLGDRAFAGDKESKMKHIALSEGIVSVGNYCFQNAQHLESIRLPQSLIDIGCNAFDNCLALNSITIPENVNKIGMDAFRLCPFTDIYLTTTDPEKIPIVFTGGNSFNSWGAGASFHHGHYDGWEALMGIHPGNAPDGYSWDDAVDWYFINANGLPVLHYPEQLADKVRADISANYHGHSSDTPSLGLPTSLDMHARETAGGANVGTSGQGIYTRDGWAQFMLMKEFTTKPGGDVYSKQYEDVWYTMCFPFDLTDEQLAAAFNETFNIVDFSGVEIQNEDESPEGKKTLILHFNTVAKTYYRDSEGNEYNVIGREKDEASGFSYNIYERGGVQYHHSQVSSFLANNKTKTFAPGNSIAEANANKDNAIIIDGYLATAGHPYMIHPAIGTSLGNPKRCDFSGIEWKPQTQWASIFEAQKREVNLGVAMHDVNDETKPDADNYFQAAYDNYGGQTYTFKGNPVQYQDGAQDAIGDEPEVLPEPVRPVKPTEEEVEALKPEGEPMVAPTVVQDPDNNSKYDDVKDLFKSVRCVANGTQYTYLEDLTNYEIGDFFWHYYNWEYATRSANHNVDNINQGEGENGFNLFKAYFSDVFVNGDYYNNSPESKFNTLKQLAADYTADKAAYAEYQVAFNAYIANRAAWAIYNAKVEELATWNDAEKEQEYQAALTAYQNSVTVHDTWVENAKSWQVLIPTGAYFLGRNGTAYPKYYREIADDTRSGATGGFWTQFTAVIIPNAAAKTGIEAELGEGTSAAANRSVEMVFDEGFLGEEKTSTEIEQIITEAEAEGQKVEYMQVVYNINGQIVREGTELTGLPKGIYIVNGKKYFVR